MVAGNIPGRTQTLPMAIYDAVQSRQYHQANMMVLLMTSLAFAGLWVAYRLGHARQEEEEEMKAPPRAVKTDGAEPSRAMKEREERGRLAVIHVH
jgi:ABC-type Fe3+ transport system permease subunit